jgi:hypothetical protein
MSNMTVKINLRERQLLVVTKAKSKDLIVLHASLPNPGEDHRNVASLHTLQPTDELVCPQRSNEAKRC